MPPHDPNETIDHLLHNSPPHLAAALLYWQQWLRDLTIPPSRRLFETLRPNEIPSTILYHFTCDALERNLRQRKDLSTTHQRLLQKSLVTLRQWIEGQQPRSSLQRLRLEFQRISLPHDPDDPAHKAFHLGIAITSNDPIKAARYLCFITSQEHDHAWLCACLSSHIEEFLLLRQQLLRLLAFRHALLEGRLGFWQASLESELFDS